MRRKEELIRVLRIRLTELCEVKREEELIRVLRIRLTELCEVKREEELIRVLRIRLTELCEVKREEEQFFEVYWSKNANVFFSRLTSRCVRFVVSKSINTRIVRTTKKDYPGLPLLHQPE
jgi:hypothetical protein